MSLFRIQSISFRCVFIATKIDDVLPKPATIILVVVTMYYVNETEWVTNGVIIHSSLVLNVFGPMIFFCFFFEKDPERGPARMTKYGSWELREFFNYATSLIIMLSLYMFQFTMLFTIWRIYNEDIMTSVVALLIRLALTLEISLEFFVCSPGAQTVFDCEPFHDL